MTISPYLSRLRGLSVTGALLCVALAPVRAEDIDIYGMPNSNTDRPNVLFILDSSIAACAAPTTSCRAWLLPTTRMFIWLPLNAQALSIASATSMISAMISVAPRCAPRRAGFIATPAPRSD